MGWTMTARWIWIPLLSGCLFGASPSKGGGQISTSETRATRTPQAGDVDVPAGYRIELIARGLNFPSGIAFGDDGAIYVAESGYSYGEVVTQARIVEIDPQGGGIRREVVRGDHGPWNGLDHLDGELYVSQGGAIELTGRVMRYGLDGSQRVLVDGLPSGDHHTNGPLARDGWIYFAQGTMTNSGVVGPDNYEFGWLKRRANAHDVPCRDVTLAGINFQSTNPLTLADDDISTGAYLPFGSESSAGQVIRGALPCSGAVMRVRPDGSNLELVAWGLRNPFGLAYGRDGIYLSENGYDVRGSRPVFGSADYLWKLEPGRWYGWPDFAGGEPINTPYYAEAGGDPKGFVLAKHPNPPPEPRARLDVHASANGFDISRSQRFGHVGNAFVALFGDMAPVVGKVMAPVGFKVVRVDLDTGIYEDFARNHGDHSGPASKLGKAGLERPVAARFDPRGETLYIVDFGVVQIENDKVVPKPGTGRLWRITKEERHATAR
jgi:glucose/arabinose dehydrogenase